MGDPTIPGRLRISASALYGVHRDVVLEAAEEIEQLRAVLAPGAMKVAVCEAMLAINADDPGGYGPIIPPTAIDWIGNAIVAAVTSTVALQEAGRDG